MEVICATSISEADEVFRVRYRAFVETERILHPSERPSGRDCDCYDTLPESTLFLGRINGVPVCSVRLMEPSECLRQMGSPFKIGLSMEEWYDLEGVALGERIAEIPKSSVVPESANQGHIVELYREVYHVCRTRGIATLLAFANLQTDNAEDAQWAVEAAVRSEAAQSRFSFSPTEGATAFFGSIRLPIEQKNYSRLPRPLRLFLALGARIAGSPRYIPPLRRYFVPIEIRAADFNKSPLILRGVRRGASL